MVLLPADGVDAVGTRSQYALRAALVSGRSAPASIMGTVSELRPPKILLVEDDAVIREATALGLRRNGFDVVTAADGPGGTGGVRARGRRRSRCST